MANLRTSGVFSLGALGGDGTGAVINYSLQFDGSADYLSRTVSASNRKTWTFSAWLKKTDLTARDTLFSGGAAGDASNLFYIQLEDNTNPGSNRDNNIKIVWREGGTNTRNLVTTATFKNTTEWVHLVLALDTTQTAASDKMKLYIDGAEVTGFAVDNRSTIGTNDNLSVNAAGSLAVSAYAYSLSGSSRFKGQIAEVHFIDGQALDATYFGETSNSQWVPKEVTGVTYGTNGFHLDFEDASTAAALGNDATANGNDFTVTGLSTSDRLNDVPLAATITRPMRRWGGMTGRSLVESGNVPTTGVLSLPDLLQQRYGPPWDGLIEYLIIGGGGKSGNNGGGGGGAGGVVTNFGGTQATMSAGSTYTITVGEGGGTVTNLHGGDSSISNIGAATAVGGGAGGSRGSLTMTSGGSGGGGAHGRSNADSSTGASGTYGQGYSGGTGTTDLGGSSAGGGGGGFGGAGGNASSQNGGNGGAGFNSSITGTSTGYAGGGAGSGLDYSSFGGVAGTASHGGGGRNTGTNGAGVDGKGGGGGGFGDGTNTGDSGAHNGGSGVVIIRMAKAGRLVKVSGTPSLPTPVNIAGTDDKYYEFTTVGSIVVQPA